MRKYRPRRQGSIDFWVLTFQVSEWLSLMVHGGFFIVIGLVLLWIGLMSGATWL